MGDSMVMMLLEDLIIYEHRGPLLTLTFLGPPIHLLPTKFPWIPIHACAGCRFSCPDSSSRCHYVIYDCGLQAVICWIITMRAGERLKTWIASINLTSSKRSGKIRSFSK